MTGTVTYYNYEKGYGFIEQDSGEGSIFFHASNCNDIPARNMRVQYAIAEGRKGFQAVNISII